MRNYESVLRSRQLVRLLEHKACLLRKVPHPAPSRRYINPMGLRLMLNVEMYLMVYQSYVNRRTDGRSEDTRAQGIVR